MSVIMHAAGWMDVCENKLISAALFGISPVRVNTLMVTISRVVVAHSAHTVSYLLVASE